MGSAIFLLLFLFSLNGGDQSGGIEDILQTMTLHTLLQEALALRAWLRVAEILLTGHSVLTDPHNEHIAVLEL